MRLNRRKIMQGVVVSHKMEKTRVVSVGRLISHPFYRKVIKEKSKFNAHDERNESREGDLVEIRSTRPLSKTKRWVVTRIIKRSPRGAGEALEPLRT